MLDDDRLWKAGGAGGVDVEERIGRPDGLGQTLWLALRGALLDLGLEVNRSADLGLGPRQESRSARAVEERKVVVGVSRVVVVVGEELVLDLSDG